MKVSVADRKTCKKELAAVSAQTSVETVVGIAIAGAILVIFVLAIARAGWGNTDSPAAGKFVGVRHEAGNISPTAETDTLPGVPTPVAGQGEEPSSDTVVRNGITIVSPQLRVPSVDTSSMQLAADSRDDASASKSFSRKQSRYANRSHTRRQPRNAANHWTAYGVAFR